MNNSVVAVVVPVYNSELYLKACIDSILHQTYQNIEVVLVNDASTDSSMDICKEYAQKDNRIVYIETDHKGAASARIAGVRKTSAEYISFCDSDDVMADDLIESLMQFEEYDLVCSNAIADFNGAKAIFSSGLKGTSYLGRDQMDFFISNMIFMNNTNERGLFVAPYAKLYKKCIIEQIVDDLDLRVRYGEDRDFLYQYVLKCNSVRLCEFAKYTYFSRSTSSTTRYDPEFFVDANRLRDSVIKAFSNHHLRDVIIPQFEEQMREVYIHGMEYKLGYKKGFSITYIFPSVRAEHKKIVLFGAGAVGKSYYKYMQLFLDKECVLWTDNRSFEEMVYDQRIHNPEDILTTKFDAIWVAMANKDSRMQVKKQLISLGVEDNKILIDQPVQTRLLYFNENT